MRHKILKVQALIIIVAILLSGCAVRRPDDKKPLVPKIPDKISRGEGREPQLTVYEVQTKTRKKMNLEDYVAGVVAGEMENNWPVEALAAQAILARTYVLEFVTDKGESKYGDADISTDFEEAQAWNPSKINDRVKKAVQMTRGKVITYRGKYVKAWFHSHSGGMTATPKEGLNYKEEEPPYITIVKSPDENAGPEGKRTWSATFTKEELRRAIKEKLGQDTGSIDEVSVVERGPSGRATKIKIGNATVPAPDLRTALDPMRMRSTLLTSLRIEGEKVIMEGKGFGHGVGLSQWGAHVLARQGKSPEEIIKYYFKGVDIVKLWD
ncbi:SpoIID/LytB domain-containing protein [Thermosediminibacter oceani]|uniref:SpoIID/LytB domain protein n=1 Tax=Thermosediminibacter oceani (strain ATCC BAA-1034 / DSM 16646 / JW/IW-1228P) TaxID=555079 RepID=D9RZJ8_THEOJ|nr:SpoIID/LytB domain-containing protein [Thermosediminibacter oceani]ADL06896.1 SpoIID/LytB domain protein [Thermosediminibacter oceani DSM 16646]